MRELHVGQCGLSDQVTLPGEETVYSVLHVLTDRKAGTFTVHTQCGTVLTLKGKAPNVVYVGHCMELWNGVVECPTCGKVCEA